MKHGGGWQAIAYTLRKARQHGPVRFWRAMRSKNACKTCAFGMGGQAGGMTNEAGRFPEVCKKSLQAMASDMRGRIEPRFFETYSLAELAGFSSRELEHCGRLAFPVIATPEDTHFRPIGWDEALALASTRMADAPPRETFVYASGRSSNEAGFLLHLLARSHGTNHVSNCSFYCHQASGVGLKAAIGTGTATVELEDLSRCDLVFLIGGNPASNHPRLMTELMRLRRRSGNVIVVNPLREVGLVNFKVPSSGHSMLFGSEIASSYIQPTIGGDIGFLTGLAKALLESGHVAVEFMDAHTEGWMALRALLETTPWEQIVATSGVARNEIEVAAEMYARSERTIFAWTMGITHHEHGVENVQWIANVALMRGMIGKPGAGLMPIRGHSNVQGMGSLGVTPQVRAIAAQRLGELGVPLPEFEGHDTLATMEAAARGEMRFALCLGGNLYGANPDASFAASALGNLDTLVHMSTTLNTGHVAARGRTTLILPVLARDEETQSTTQESMFSFVRLSEGGPARHEGPRGESAVLAEIGLRVFGGSDAPHPALPPIADSGGRVPGVDGDDSGTGNHSTQAQPAQDPDIDHNPSEPSTRSVPATGGRAGWGASEKPGLDWNALKSHDAVRALIARLVPELAPIADIGTTKREFHIPERVLHEPKFPTPTGRASLSALRIPPAQTRTEGQLLLMTIRSEGQFNTVVYEEADLYRGQERRDVILLHPADMVTLRLAPDQPVEVSSNCGNLRVLARPFNIARGCAAMYFPEANVLVPRTADPQSRTPAYKCVVVDITPCQGYEAQVTIAFAAGKRDLGAC